MSTVTLIQADARRSPLADRSVQCVVTSPPYWGGIRDYGLDAQIGMERDPSCYVGELVKVFHEVHRVITADGVAWLNIGDVYAAGGKGGGGSAGDRTCWASVAGRVHFRMPPAGYKMKDLTLVAFQVADALRRDGWYLRSTVVWQKPSAVEPIRLDRPSLSHEYLFQFSKSEHYCARDPGESWWGHSVWTIRADADSPHPAPIPRELVRRCIVCSSKPGDVVFDPFGGAGTVPLVASNLGRRGIMTELSPDYIRMARRRIERPHARPERLARAEHHPLFSGIEG
jgi:site-specific DNA-methyltransferase (cytosine-N4-specific)